MISEEKKQYPLPERRDEQILELIHSVEKLDLSGIERFLVLWTRTQLEEDWRTPLIQILELMLDHADKSSEERLDILGRFAEENFWHPQSKE